jgi:hypothetical protein
VDGKRERIGSWHRSGRSVGHSAYSRRWSSIAAAVVVGLDSRWLVAAAVVVAILGSTWAVAAAVAILGSMWAVVVAVAAEESCCSCCLHSCSCNCSSCWTQPKQSTQPMEPKQSMLGKPTETQQQVLLEVVSCRRQSLVRVQVRAPEERAQVEEKVGCSKHMLEYEMVMFQGTSAVSKGGAAAEIDTGEKRMTPQNLDLTCQSYSFQKWEGHWEYPG